MASAPAVCCVCNKPSKLLCPTCKKLGLPPSYYCGKECFKSNWKVHKKLHKMVAKAKATQKIVEASAKPRSSLDVFKGFKFRGKLRPAEVAPQMTVKVKGIDLPDYALTGDPVSEREADRSRRIEVKTKDQIERMRRVCKLGREVLDAAGKAVAAGVTTDRIDKIVFMECMKRGCYPSPLNYRGFPKSVCTSVNNSICHAIPDQRPLQNGDIVNLDVTVFKEGVHADLNETFFVGEVSDDARELVQTAFECLRAALELVKPGTLYRNLGPAIDRVARKAGCSVVRAYCGHGIGTLFHTSPNVPHYKKNKAVGVMKEGHVFTIEPMINRGHWEAALWPDDWTAVTCDGKWSAQFEHTILVTSSGYELLTAREGETEMRWDAKAFQR